MRLTRSIVAATAVFFVAMPAMAEPTESALKVWEATGQSGAVQIMREEGLEYGAQIGTDMFPDRLGIEWDDTLSRIYDIDVMEGTAKQALSDALGDVDVAPILAFFETETGQQIVELEISARRAMLDDSIDEASREAAKIAAMDETPRYELLTEFITVNDLIEANVVGGLNSNLAFYQGMMTSAPVEGADTSNMMADVWAQEGQIRDSTTEWVYAYLLLAYQPLSDEQLSDYIAFSKTEEGKVLNRSLFAAYDGLFNSISHVLGLEAGRRMTGADL